MELVLAYVRQALDTLGINSEDVISVATLVAGVTIIMLAYNIRRKRQGVQPNWVPFFIGTSLSVLTGLASVLAYMAAPVFPKSTILTVLVIAGAAGLGLMSERGSQPVRN